MGTVYSRFSLHFYTTPPLSEFYPHAQVIEKWNRKWKTCWTCWLWREIDVLWSERVVMQKSIRKNVCWYCFVQLEVIYLIVLRCKNWICVPCVSILIKVEITSQLIKCHFDLVWVHSCTQSDAVCVSVRVSWDAGLGWCNPTWQQEEDW